MSFSTLSTILYAMYWNVILNSNPALQMSSKQLLWGEKPSAMFKRGSTGSPRLTIIYSATTHNYDSDGQGGLIASP